jgi:hypothetical protein
MGGAALVCNAGDGAMIVRIVSRCEAITNEPAIEFKNIGEE